MNHITSPDSGDSAIEREIQAKGKTAPRVTPADIEAEIASEYYFTAGDGVAGAGSIVAGEFWNYTTGHCIVDYSEHTHIGHLTVGKGIYAPSSGLQSQEWRDCGPTFAAHLLRAGAEERLHRHW